MAKNLIGIEVGNAKLVIYNGSKLVVKDLPENVVENSFIVDENKFAQFLANVMKEEGIGGKDVAVVLPDNASFFRTLNLQPMTDQELKLNLPYEFRDYVGEEANEYFYDYAMNEIEYDEDGNALSMELFAAAGRKDIVNQLARVLKAAGLRIATALPREMTLIYMFRVIEAAGVLRDKEYCLLDIGSRFTRMYVMRDGKLVGNKHIELAASNYNDATEKQAVYDKLAIEIMKAFNFYKYQHQDSDIKDIFFCGTQSEDEALRHTIMETLDVAEGKLTDILPDAICEIDGIARGLAVIGATD